MNHVCMRLMYIATVVSWSELCFIRILQNTYVGLMTYIIKYITTYLIHIEILAEFSIFLGYYHYDYNINSYAYSYSNIRSYIIKTKCLYKPAECKCFGCHDRTLIFLYGSFVDSCIIITPGLLYKQYIPQS